MNATADACPCQAYGAGGGGGTPERCLNRINKKWMPEGHMKKMVPGSASFQK